MAAEAGADSIDLGRPGRRSRWATLRKHLAWTVVGGLALYLLTISVDPYRNLQIATIAYTAIAAAGLTVLTGSSGQISLGQGAFMAVGAYTTALLLIHREDWPLGVVLIVSTLFTAVAGALVGAAAARLRGPYLAGATLAFAVGLPALADYRGLREQLGGGNGLSVATKPPPLRLGETFPLERWQAWICGLCLVLTLLLLANLQSGRIGRHMRAVRDDEVAASLAGVSVARTQILAFVISAACAGLAGGLLAFVNSLAAPGAFQLTVSFQLLAVVVIGGLGSLAGAVYGSILLVLLPGWSADLAQQLDLSRDIYANLPLALYGVVLVAVILGFPAGLQGALVRLARLLRGPSRPPTITGR